MCVSPLNDKPTAAGSRMACCRVSCFTRIVAVVAVLSVNNNADAFTGIVRPMSHPEQRINFSSSGFAAIIARGSRPSSVSKMASGSTGEEELGLIAKITTAWGTVIEQAVIFSAVFAGLGAGTVAVLAGLKSLEMALPAGWYSTWQSTWPPSLGLIFAAAGVAHFTILKEFCAIYPGRGAWGFWYVPGTSSFHVKWTGIAELAGGIALALGGLGVGGAELGLVRAAAAGLFALVLAVTPANIYMFTHGAQLPEGSETPVVGHAIRGFFQCVLLAFFWTLASSP